MIKLTLFGLSLVCLWSHVSAYAVREGTDNEDFLKVETSNGFVKGFLGKTCRSQKRFAGFRGIPYAEPPVGHFRFRAPLEKRNWTGVYDATFQRSGCMQTAFGGSDKENANNKTYSEDCLYLNVYTPNINYLRDHNLPLRAVMVFIHGGAFLVGSSYESSYGPDFLVEKDVVLVTFNYRLGAFGFLSLQNAEVPGNAALKDQVLALKWVRKNIRAFGGDPNKVTIFGESAGSASVNYHMLSKSSAGLFQRAIMESGSALVPWAYMPPKEAVEKAQKLGITMKCPRKNLDQLLLCLRRLSPKYIAETLTKLVNLKDIVSTRIIPFGPTQEPDVPGAFLTGYPFDLLYSGNFTKVPTIIGSNSNEGLVVYPVLSKNALSDVIFTLIGMDLSRFVPYQLQLQPTTVTAIKVHQAISKFYFHDASVTKKKMFQVLELIGDVSFILPIQLTAKLIAEHSPHPVYNYHFTYDGGYGVYKSSSNMTHMPGVCHADELGYLFHIPGLHKECGQSVQDDLSQDEVIVDHMTDMWRNFAETGDPTPSKERGFHQRWNEFTANEPHYFDIGESLVPAKGVRQNHMQFWDNIVRLVLSNKRSVFAESSEPEPEDEERIDLMNGLKSIMFKW